MALCPQDGSAVSGTTGSLPLLLPLHTRALVAVDVKQTDVQLQRCWLLPKDVTTELHLPRKYISPFPPSKEIPGRAS
jgi:hypothetical protein